MTVYPAEGDIKTVFIGYNARQSKLETLFSKHLWQKKNTSKWKGP
jgi:hypothetical protein